MGLLWIDLKQDYGWYREWHCVTYDEGQVNTQIVLAQDFVTTTGASTYTSKASWNNANNTVETVGGGGAGARGASTSTGGGGGGGGAYNKITNFNFATPGTTTASVSVGIGGVWTSSSITNGGDTWFNGASLAASSVGCKGGASPATFNTATGGAGGLHQVVFQRHHRRLALAVMGQMAPAHRSVVVVAAAAGQTARAAMPAATPAALVMVALSQVARLAIQAPHSLALNLMPHMA